jgi:UPF0755 protein
MLVVLVAVAAFFGGALFAAFRADLIAFGRRPAGRDVGARIVVTIERGSSPAVVGAVLEDHGVVKDGRDFARWLVRVAKAEHTIKAGTYALSPEMTPEEILAELQKGLQHEVRFTIPEGFDQLQIADVLHDAGFGELDDILEVMTDPDFIAECGVPDDVPGGVEGYLFPDTYQFPPGTPVRRILRRMRARLDEVLDDDVKAKMQARGMSLHETLTMASLVEEEAAVARERRRIAGVFHRRLRKGMKLQTDPTVLYGVEPRDPEQPRRIRKSDLQREHAYNTYTNTGLPPGPISSPGLASIRAAVTPDDDDSLFFVARGDGTHEFCATLACHEEAVGRYILGHAPSSTTPPTP